MTSFRTNNATNLIGVKFPAKMGGTWEVIARDDSMAIKKGHWLVHHLESGRERFMNKTEIRQRLVFQHQKRKGPRMTKC